MSMERRRRRGFMAPLTLIGRHFIKGRCHYEFTCLGVGPFAVTLCGNELVSGEGSFVAGSDPEQELYIAALEKNMTDIAGHGRRARLQVHIDALKAEFEEVEKVEIGQ